MIQEALRTHFGEPVYRPTDVGREELVAALERVHADPTSVRDWSDVREDARCRQPDPVSSHAVSDLEHAHDYYLADTGAALGGRFLDDVEALIERIEMFPAGGPTGRWIQRPAQGARAALPIRHLPPARPFDGRVASLANPVQAPR